MIRQTGCPGDVRVQDDGRVTDTALIASNAAISADCPISASAIRTSVDRSVCESFKRSSLLPPNARFDSRVGSALRNPPRGIEIPDIYPSENRLLKSIINVKNYQMFERPARRCPPAEPQTF
jgi:hypothetical protein